MVGAIFTEGGEWGLGRLFFFLNNTLGDKLSEDFGEWLFFSLGKGFCGLVDFIWNIDLSSDHVCSICLMYMYVKFCGLVLSKVDYT